MRRAPKPRRERVPSGNRRLAAASLRQPAQSCKFERLASVAIIQELTSKLTGALQAARNFAALATRPCERRAGLHLDLDQFARQRDARIDGGSRKNCFDPFNTFNRMAIRPQWKLVIKVAKRLTRRCGDRIGVRQD